MTLHHIALDVIREAFARRYLLGLFGIIAVGLLTLMFSLDLEVVEGALAAGRLFGQQMGDGIVPVDVALRPIFEALAWFVFYFGLLFGVVVTADIAPKMLAPGRVELLLALPVRRVELVLGTFLGVLAIALLATTFAVGGVSLILFAKAGFTTVAPLLGAIAAFVAFVAVYAVMLLVTTLVRSTTLAAGSAVILYLIGVVTSDRKQFLSFFKSGAVKEILGVLVAPIPRLRALADIGADAATGASVHLSTTLPLVLSTLTFAAFAVALACYVVSGKDY